MADAIYGTPVHGSAQGVEISARLDSTMAGWPRQCCLIMEITVEPGLHVYGQPIPDGFIPLTADVTPAPGLGVGKTTFPPPVLHRMEGLDEEFFIYEGTVVVATPLTVASAQEPGTVELKVRYQACGEMGCFMPQTIVLHLPVPA
ncbi:MAG: protein-disulfide reductase DsbD domain-containing protein [Candidatus Tectimicrobiota bacterium]